jgi:hypothetical protein
MYNVTSRLLRVTNVAVDQQYILRLLSELCGLSYLRFKAHVQCYIVIRGLSVCLSLTYVYTLYYKKHEFRKKNY